VCDFPLPWKRDSKEVPDGFLFAAQAMNKLPTGSCLRSEWHVFFTRGVYTAYVEQMPAYLC